MDDRNNEGGAARSGSTEATPAGERTGAAPVGAPLRGAHPATVIHQYLQNLTGDDADAARRKVATRDAVGALVAQLADHLHAEAERTIAAAKQASDRLLAERNEALAQRTAELAATEADRQRAEAALRARNAEYADAMHRLEERTVEVAKLEERTQGLAHEIANLNHHIESLEQARDQSRSALERYQAAAKEQQAETSRNFSLQLQELRKGLDQANTALKAKSAELVTVDGARARLAQQVDDATKDRRLWEQERQRLTADAKEHQSVLRERDRQRDSLNQAARDRERVERELAASRSALEKERTGNRSAQVALARSQARVQTLELVVAELRVNLTSRHGSGDEQ